MSAINVLEFRTMASPPSKSESQAACNASLVAASALFAGIPPMQCREIAAVARLRVFAQDEILFMQGHPVRTHILVQSGHVKVTQVSSTGREVLLWMNGPGESVCTPAESPSRHACSARATQRCHALTWEDSRFQSILARFPQVNININHMLCARLSELEQRFREIATEKVPARLSFALLRLATQLGKPTLGGTEISLSREELAQMIGTTLFTVSRILSKWADEGFIAPRRNGVVILDSGRLLLAGVESERIPA